MALKRKITKTEFEALAKDVQKVYTADGENYLLDLEGVDDVDELRRAKDREAAAAKELKKQLKEAQAKLKELEDDGDANDKDVAMKKLEAKITKLEAGLTEKETEAATKLAAKDNYIKSSMITAAATQIATKISTVPTVMSKVIAERLSVDFEGDAPKLVILDSAGKASALTLDQLSKELVANKEYAAIIIGSKASGSGAPRDGNNQNRLPPGGTGDGKPPDLSKMSPKDLGALLKERKEANQQ